MRVKPKKHLGQHFLKDESICTRISESIRCNCENLVEVGPGTGALTQQLLTLKSYRQFYVMEVDLESIKYLENRFPDLTSEQIINGDFLEYDTSKLFRGEPFVVAGNFPYNISSQILFKCLEYKYQIPEIVGMFQKEVAERISQGPGKKAYGILSVFMQAYYDIEYLFTVDEHVFEPPPKV